MDLNVAPEAERLRDLWADHQATAWPESVPPGGDEEWDRAGVEPVMLNADIAGIISTVVGSRRPPDMGQQDLLRSLLADLDKAWPVVPTDAQPHLQRLRDMAHLALATAGRPS